MKVQIQPADSKCESVIRQCVQNSAMLKEAPKGRLNRQDRLASLFLQREDESMPGKSYVPAPTLRELQCRADQVFARARQAIAQAIQIDRKAREIHLDLRRSIDEFNGAVSRSR
jgi:hypothetical protein